MTHSLTNTVEFSSRSMPKDCTMDDLISVMGEGRLKKVA
jgi:hypothetical protein